MDLWAGISFFFGQIGKLLFSLGSHFSLTSLGAALLISAAWFVWMRFRRGRRLRCAHHLARAVSRAAFIAHRSNQADIGYLFFNVFVFGVVFGWAVLSYQFLSNGIIAALNATLGPVAPTDPACLRHALGDHRDAVPRLRARLLVQSLALAQGAAAVGIPQSAPHRRGAHAADEFPRAPGL